MALTQEILVANAALAGLTAEQIEAVVTLSQNDENTVIGSRIGEIYRQMDETIKTATGIERDGAEKTYNYLSRATKAFAEKFSDYDTLKSQITELTQQKASLEAQIAKGGDEALKTQLANVQNELASTKTQFNTLKEQYDTEKAGHEKAMNDYKIDSVISQAKEGIKFKAGYNQTVLDTLVSQAINAVKAKNPSFEERNGKSVLVFHDANGAPLNNAENKLNPFTAQELLMKEFAAMDILEVKKPKTGTGTRVPVEGGSGTLGASTQVEAEAEISKTLAQKGLVRGTSEYQEEFTKIWTENKVSDLPRK